MATSKRSQRGPQPLTQKQLDQLKCSTPGCQHSNCILTLRSMCHCAPTFVNYNKFTGILQILCCVCKSLVVEIAVKEK